MKVGFHLFEDTDGDGEVDSINITATVTQSDFGRWGSPLYGCYINALYGTGGGHAQHRRWPSDSLSEGQAQPPQLIMSLILSDEVWERPSIWRVKKNIFEGADKPISSSHHRPVRFA